MKLIFLLMFETYSHFIAQYSGNQDNLISDLQYRNSYLRDHLYQSDLELMRLKIQLKQILATCAPTTITTTDRDARTVIAPV